MRSVSPNYHQQLLQTVDWKWDSCHEDSLANSRNHSERNLISSRWHSSSLLEKRDGNKNCFSTMTKVMKNFEASWKVFFIKFRLNFSLRIMANNKALKRKKKSGLHVYANDIILFRLLFLHFCIHLWIAHKKLLLSPPPLPQFHKPIHCKELKSARYVYKINADRRNRIVKSCKIFNDAINAFWIFSFLRKKSIKLKRLRRRKEKSVSHFSQWIKHSSNYY